MRILHTSDWHLGRSFHGEDLLAAQAAYVDHLIETVEAEGSTWSSSPGDVYDRALPPVDAVALADDAFTRLAASRARVVVTSGNHDSARRLGLQLAPGRRCRRAPAHRRRPCRTSPCCSTTSTGRSRSTASPTSSPTSSARAWDLPTRSHHAALAEAMRRIRADLATRPAGTRSVVHGARLRRRRPAQRERARHRGRRHLRRAARAVRRHRLRRARPPARPRHADRLRALQRVAAGLLVLRGRPRQGLLAGRPRRRRACERALRRRPGRARRSRAWRAPSTTCSPTPRSTPHEESLGAGDAHRRRPAAARDGAAARPLPARPRPAVRAGRRRGRRDRARSTARPVAPTRSRSTSSRHVRGAPATAAESDLLRDGARVLHGGSRPRRRARRGGERLMRLHELSITAFGPFVDTVTSTSTSSPRAGCSCSPATPAPARPACSTRSASRSTARSPATGTAPGTCAATTPTRGRAAGASCELSVGGRTLPVHPLPRVGPAEAARHRHHPSPGPRRRRGARRRRVGRADQPARRGRPAGHRAARDDLHPVHPGGDAAPGPVPGVPAGHLRRAARRAAAAVPHRAASRTSSGGWSTAGSTLRRAARPATTGAPGWSTASRRLPGSAYPLSGTCTTSTRSPTTVAERWAADLAATPATAARDARGRPGRPPRPPRARAAGRLRPRQAGRRGPGPWRAGARHRWRELDETADVEAALAASLDAHRRAASVLPAAVRAETPQTQHAARPSPRRRGHVADGRAAARLDAGRGRPPRWPRPPRVPARPGPSPSPGSPRAGAARRARPAHAPLHELARRSSLARSRAEARSELSRPRQTRQRAGASARRDPRRRGRTARPRRPPSRPPRGRSPPPQEVAAAGAGDSSEARVLLEQPTEHAQDLREHLPRPARDGGSPGWPPSWPWRWPSGVRARSAGASEHPVPRGRLRDASAAPTRRPRASATRPPTSSARPSRSSVTALEAQLAGALAAARASTSPTGSGRTTRPRQPWSRARAAAGDVRGCTRPAGPLDARDSRLARPTLASARGATSRTRTQQHAESRGPVLDRSPPSCASCSRTTRALDRGRARRAALDGGDVSSRKPARPWPRTSALPTSCPRRPRRPTAAAATAGFRLARRRAGRRAARRRGGRALDRARRSTGRARRRRGRARRDGGRRGPGGADLPTWPPSPLVVREAEQVRDRAHAAHQQARRPGGPARGAGSRARRRSWRPGSRCAVEHALVAGLASLVEGKSADNQLKMRLSAYVLSERLRQVVAAANERLGDMTDERYTLEQADEKGAGEQRGGLSLRVRDEWSGKHRDPATLVGRRDLPGLPRPGPRTRRHGEPRGRRHPARHAVHRRGLRRAGRHHARRRDGHARLAA